MGDRSTPLILARAWVHGRNVCSVLPIEEIHIRVKGDTVNDQELNFRGMRREDVFVRMHVEMAQHCLSTLFVLVCH